MASEQWKGAKGRRWRRRSHVDGARLALEGVLVGGLLVEDRDVLEVDGEALLRLELVAPELEELNARDERRLHAHFLEVGGARRQVVLVALVDERRVLEVDAHVGHCRQLGRLHHLTVGLVVALRVHQQFHLLQRGHHLPWYQLPGLLETLDNGLVEAGDDLEDGVVVAQLEAGGGELDEAAHDGGALLDVGGEDDLRGNPRAHAVEVGDECVDGGRGGARLGGDGVGGDDAREEVELDEGKLAREVPARNLEQLALVVPRAEGHRLAEAVAGTVCQDCRDVVAHDVLERAALQLERGGVLVEEGLELANEEEEGVAGSLVLDEVVDEEADPHREAELDALEADLAHLFAPAVEVAVQHLHQHGRRRVAAVEQQQRTEVLLVA
mmetsp:Transcript_13562/g.53773  ORF Transcript_13562/g.53773 Transcript_13562/m.53773 type:complete len:383 (+) Transcript_13562:22-1170(+)